MTRVTRVTDYLTALIMGKKDVFREASSQYFFLWSAVQWENASHASHASQGGAAMNEGRGLFHKDDDKGFGQWVADNLLCQLDTVEIDAERAAAMWAAGLSDRQDCASRPALLARPTLERF